MRRDGAAEALQALLANEAFEIEKNEASPADELSLLKAFSSDAVALDFGQCLRWLQAVDAPPPAAATPRPALRTDLARCRDVAFSEAELRGEEEELSDDDLALTVRESDDSDDGGAYAHDASPVEFDPAPQRRRRPAAGRKDYVRCDVELSSGARCVRVVPESRPFALEEYPRPAPKSFRRTRLQGI